MLVDLEIRRIKENEIYFICSTFYCFEEFVEEAEEYLSEINFIGDVIVDSLVTNYDVDSDIRFTKYSFKDNKLDMESSTYLKLDKDNIYRKMTSEYFLSTIGTDSEVFLLPDFAKKLIKGEIL